VPKKRNDKLGRQGISAIASPFHQKNLEFIFWNSVQILLENDYPINFIFDINNRLKWLINKKSFQQKNDNNKKINN